ncbi:MAG: glycoside hydrolase family 15 protein [Actinomycetota bacterium]|nr:glycoside hydrolase family 15 protein [Actinomycetota bacterium]
MTQRIEDYGLIGDTQTAALVGRDGSIDWLCLPRFDSAACFAALLGDHHHGRWLLEPAGGAAHVSRRYLPDTLVLETEMETAAGVVRVVDCMPPRHVQPDVVRVVQGVRGRVPMRMELVVRLDYGSIVPWVRRLDGSLSFVAGPDALELRTPVETKGMGLTTVAEFSVAAGQQVPFVLTWHPSHEAPPPPIDALVAQRDTAAWWREWAGRCHVDFGWEDVVRRSLLTLKALTYAPTGGIVAAATTSLPEQLGGVRNWDYRFCWLRDATFTLYALMIAGYEDEARAWRDWLLRAVAGQPTALQIMYGPAGERRLPEYELDWLPGYEESAPVRIGNAASRQLQLDVYGEVMDAMHQARRAGIEPSMPAWDLQRALLEFLESGWREPDEGIWEVRGPRRHFTHSKVMAWVAMDRGVKAVERFRLEGPVDRWRRCRQTIHDEVCQKGYDVERGSFTQYYGSKELDASLLLMALVGFLPPGDERVRGTVEAIERELCHDGFVMRYPTGGDEPVDGLPGREGAFLACSFWLADNLALLGRGAEARALFERLISLRSDVGLLAEEYDPAAGRMVGNFPQAFSHVALVNTARNLSRSGGPMQDRRST